MDSNVWCLFYEQTTVDGIVRRIGVTFEVRVGEIPVLKAMELRCTIKNKWATTFRDPAVTQVAHVPTNFTMLPGSADASC